MNLYFRVVAFLMLILILGGLVAPALISSGDTFGVILGVLTLIFMGAFVVWAVISNFFFHGAKK